MKEEDSSLEVEFSIPQKEGFSIKNIDVKIKSVFLIIIFFISFLIYDDNNIDYGVDGCNKNSFNSLELNDFEGNTNITFIAFGDSQIYKDHTVEQNDFQVIALNHFTELLSWEDAGFSELGEIEDIRGIIMAGDITQNGRDGRMFSFDEYGEFVERYGLCGNKQVDYPIYEGYGNHDYFEWSNIFYRIPADHPVADSVAIRNEYRPGIMNTAPNMEGHYSWEWDDFHFIQLNLAPTDIVPDLGVKGLRDPRNAMTFLENDLKENIEGTDKKVILISHYGPWEWREWDQNKINNLCQVVENYSSNIVSYIHGHSHSTSVYDWCDLTVFNSGTPYHENYNDDHRGRFTLFRINEANNGTFDLYAADISWSTENYQEDDITSLDLQMKEWKGYPYHVTF